MRLSDKSPQKTAPIPVDLIVLVLQTKNRGIDVQQVSLVINYDLPTNREVRLRLRHTRSH